MTLPFCRTFRTLPGARHNRALTLVQLGRNEEALAEWQIALSLPEESQQRRAKMILTRGWVFEQTGDFEKAEKDYTAIVTDSMMPALSQLGALQLRAALFVRIKELSSARADLETILQRPDVPESEREKAQMAIRELKKIPGE